MKIIEVHVKNFRSLRDVALTNLDNLVVLVGKNGSGKSHILESLSMFFSEFALVGGTTPGINDYFWFNRRRNAPIAFRVVLDLGSELEQILPKKIFDEMKSRFGESTGKLAVDRSIPNVQGNWKTERLAIHDLTIVKDDKLLTVGEANLSSLDDKPEGFAPIPYGLTAQELNIIQTELLKRIKGVFRLIPAARDTKNPSQYRLSLFDNNVQSELWRLQQSTDAGLEADYVRFENVFRRLTGLRLDPAGGQVAIRRDITRIPLYLEGGGIQSATNLLFDILTGDKQLVLGLEEPESHSHPDLQRRLLDELKELARDRQIFVVTHSAIFVDRTELEKTLLVKMAGDETKVVHVGEVAEVLQEIGSKPSDLLFSNRIVFVEGPSDIIVLKAFASKLNVDLNDADFVPLRGKSNANRALKTWLTLTRGAVPIFVILDNDGQEEAKAVIKDGLIERRLIHTWRLGSIEHYYPLEALRVALRRIESRYGFDLKVDAVIDAIHSANLSPDKIDIGPKKELLDKSWEVVLAEEIADALNQKDYALPEEIRTVLNQAISAN